MRIIPIKASFRTIILIVITIVIILSGCYLTNVLSPHTIVMNKNNYVALLQEIHNNTFDYSGDKIKLSGYIFRLPDFQNNQFVIARNMLISETEYRVVGFLCEYSGQDVFETDSWVTAEGVITLDYYHGPIPIIKLTKISHSKMPNNIYVKPPS